MLIQDLESKIKQIEQDSGPGDLSLIPLLEAMASGLRLENRILDAANADARANAIRSKAGLSTKPTSAPPAKLATKAASSNSLCAACKTPLKPKDHICPNCGARDNRRQKQCPSCLEMVNFFARKCKFCHEDLPNLPYGIEEARAVLWVLISVGFVWYFFSDMFTRQWSAWLAAFFFLIFVVDLTYSLYLRGKRGEQI